MQLKGYRATILFNQHYHHHGIKIALRMEILGKICFQWRVFQENVGYQHCVSALWCRDKNVPWAISSLRYSLDVPQVASNQWIHAFTLQQWPSCRTGVSPSDLYCVFCYNDPKTKTWTLDWTVNWTLDWWCTLLIEEQVSWLRHNY